MKIVFIGDISGEPGRETVAKVLPEIRKKYQPDLVIANCENAASGRGVTAAILTELQAAGVDFFTAGDHVWRIKSFLTDLQNPSLPIVRPYNYEAQKTLPGKGFDIIDLGGKGRVVVACLLGQSFMRFPPRNPFWAADDLLAEFKTAGVDFEKDTIIIDFHAETTAEKVCLAYYLKDKVAAVLGTHTHVATADNRLVGNTAFVTDVGMTGPLDASLWVKMDTAIHNFKYPFGEKYEVEEEGRMVFNAVLVEVDHNKASKIERIDKILN